MIVHVVEPSEYAWQTCRNVEECVSWWVFDTVSSLTVPSNIGVPWDVAGMGDVQLIVSAADLRVQSAWYVRAHHTFFCQRVISSDDTHLWYVLISTIWITPHIHVLLVCENSSQNSSLCDKAIRKESTSCSLLTIRRFDPQRHTCIQV